MSLTESGPVPTDVAAAADGLLASPSRAPRLSGKRTISGDRQPLTPTLEAWAWQTLAECRGMDSSVFFAVPDEGRAAKRLREAAAQAVCGACLVREKCADFAVRTREVYGVWGGLTERERGPGPRPTGSAQQRHRTSSA